MRPADLQRLIPFIIQKSEEYETSEEIIIDCIQDWVDDGEAQLSLKRLAR